MKSFWTLVLLVVLVSCNEELKEQQMMFDSLKQQAMESHDVIMPKMELLKDLSDQLTEQIDSTNTDVIMSKKGALEKAHDDMMVWMRDYSEKFPYEYQLPEDVDAAKEQISILKDEYAEIEELKVRTLKVIDEAKAMLN